MEIVLFSIPEALVVSWLVHILSGSKLSWSKLVAIGILTGVFSALFRDMVGNYPAFNFFPVTMVMYAFVLILLFYIFRAAQLWKVMVSVAFAMPIYLLSEFLCMTLILAIFKVTPLDFMDNISLKFLCFLPQLIMITLVALLFLKFNINLFVDYNDIKKEV